ncbi:TPA: glycosyltransferase [Citrobacter sedlakii]|nr:glycosyltransferase [Citrobacter sedlakii]HCA7081561.1 glycosyltransferase [Citrobacter sedlakii]HCA7134869.1 glycosyltransferase [Citrobacter sedlakii]HCA7138138.1 glycosyltransferase [Citrobacter sedlakii]HCA7180837.1 glycosyltransferase [Citrobacter sedlakii]
MSTSSTSHSRLTGILKPLATGREKPFVSVVTPTWNRAAFLPSLLYLYRYQDYPAARRELVILDDSPQSSLPLIEKLTQGKPDAFNIRYIHHPERLALGKKRNMLNELAVGEYILCMDDDDYYPADKISYTIEMMQRHGALISGSDQIPIWYSHINRIFKTHRFGPKNILNGTFCYHRYYLKKHRYDDDCNLSEEKGFTNNFTVNPLQLPGERTILCISHSHNTFDKDFVLGSSQPLDATLEQMVPDPMLRNGYLSLHNATHHQALRWDAIDQIVIINLDKRPDRLSQIQQELARLKFPPEKIRRLAASEDPSGQRGRKLSHLRALQLAQQQGWNNVLVMEDDTVILKQEKHVQVLNTLLAALPTLPWEAILLGGDVKRGTTLKSLNGIIHARDGNKVCALLVNSRYYATLIQQMQQDPSDILEEQWQPLMSEGKWLACYPSICYQREGYSDIEQKVTDNIRYYFNKINQAPAPSPEPDQTRPNTVGDTVGFFLETAFHFHLYRPIIAALQARGQRCALLVNDRVPKTLRDEILALLKSLKQPELGGSLLSQALTQKQRYRCLVSPYYMAELQGLADIHIRAMQGLADEGWNYAWWNVFYQRILCFASYSQRAVDICGSARMVGNPRFDCLASDNDAIAPPSVRGSHPQKPTLLYAPTVGAGSAVPHWAEKIARLQQDANVLLLCQHSRPYGHHGETLLALLHRHFKHHIVSHDDALRAFKQTNYVLTDCDDTLFDAIHLNKPAIRLAMPERPPAPVLPHLIPTVMEMAALRDCLSPAFDWPVRLAALEAVRDERCDPFRDGNAGARAAQEIIDCLEGASAETSHSLLTSLQQRLFASHRTVSGK